MRHCQFCLFTVYLQQILRRLLCRRSSHCPNSTALIEDLSHSGEPLYLTRNGSACVVVMDSAAFDAAMAFRNEIYEQEMRTYRGMLKGIQEMQEGKLHDAQDVMDELRALRGWE